MITATRPWSGPPVSVTGREPELDWRQRAACVDAHPDLFFAPDDHAPRGSKAAREAEAKRICRDGCPVLLDCLEAALDEDDRHAIRGGLTPKERKQQFGTGQRKAVVV